MGPMVAKAGVARSRNFSSRAYRALLTILLATLGGCGSASDLCDPAGQRRAIDAWMRVMKADPPRGSKEEIVRWGKRHNVDMVLYDKVFLNIDIFDVKGPFKLPDEMRGAVAKAECRDPCSSGELVIQVTIVNGVAGSYGASFRSPPCNPPRAS